MGESNSSQIEAWLNTADIDIEGRMPWSSNATFRIDLLVDSEPVGKAIYKPHRGERPLWDFPSGLYQREVAAYRLSAWLGWNLVPPTVERDGPHGIGSIQWFIDAHFDQHYFTLFETRTDLHDRLMAMAAFDALSNNTDRKGGHVLLGQDDSIWGIDHGLCFAAEYKLRTVIWEFGGDPIPDKLLSDIERLATSVPLSIAALLNANEVEALQDRAAELAESGVFPEDPTGHRYPWPLV